MKAQIKFTNKKDAGRLAFIEGHSVPASFPEFADGPLSFSKGEIMKTAKSIVELATEIQRQSESKKDFIVPTQAVDPSGQTLTGRDEMSKDFKFSRDWIEHCKEWRKEKSEKGEPSSLAQYKLQHGLMSKQEYVKIVIAVFVKLIFMARVVNIVCQKGLGEFVEIATPKVG